MSKLTKALTAAAGNAGGALGHVEDVFSTYVYEGSNGARTIANGISLSDEGGLVWLKQRGALDSHVLFDTVNGPQKSLASNDTAAGADYSSYLSFPSAGTAGWNLAGAVLNGTGTTWASWSFRKAEKFFDVVTYTGDGTSNRQISHNLGSTPGFILIKRTDSTGNWLAWHKEVNPGYGILDLTLAFTTGSNGFFDSVTDTYFETSWLNTSGGTFVAYLFASDAGGYGDDGDENIIKCGSVTTGAGAIADVSLGWEPQWVLVKTVSEGGVWYLIDNMRGFVTYGASGSKTFFANSSNPESDIANFGPTADGFKFEYGSGSGTDLIYIAIRRPMKTPESGTEVFAPVLGVTAGTTVTGFPVDYTIAKNPNAGQQNFVFTRVLGETFLATQSTAAESITGVGNQFDVQNGIKLSTWFGVSSTVISWNFKRATGFMDVVAYTGNGTPSNTARRDLKHNLGVAPELAILKRRSTTSEWQVAADGKQLYLNLTNGSVGTYTPASYFNATDFDVEGWVSEPNNNVSGSTYIVYLFATLAGVSKVGSYTGNAGYAVNVDCGFAAGARFILIKRTDSTGDWYTYDSARGIVSGNDPYLLLNSTAAEVTNTDYIDPLSSGFTVTSSAPAALNASGGNYIFLAIA